jgi:hypothetical protein
MADKAPESWVGLFHGDPRPWILASDEAPARWVALSRLMDLSDDEAEPERAAAVASPMVQQLIPRLTPWGEEAAVSGHDRPAYVPNILHLMADMGLRGGDDEKVEDTLDALSGHQYQDGRFLAYGRAPGHAKPLWGSLPCDTHIITEALIRYGRVGQGATQRGLDRVASDLQLTNQGPGWTCIPDPAVGFRGPGRRGDVCPQVTLEALRLFSRIDPGGRPERLEEAAITALAVWRDRGGEQPYMFGHGYRFKTVKWPPLWYGVYWSLDTLSRYPGLWRSGPPWVRQALADLLACLVGYNVSADGTVTPRSVYRGFESFSYGQKKRPSPWATALTAKVVRRLSDITEEALTVEPGRLTSSKGGSGAPVLPR